MIKANELRSGNYLKLVGESWTQQVRGSIWKITAQDILDIEEGADGYEPIRLSSEILKILGFEEHFGIWQVSYNQRLRVIFLHENYDDNSKSVYYEYIYQHTKKRIILYIHQLQNLYFALTDEELIVKL